MLQLVRILPQTWIPAIGRTLGLGFYYLGIRRKVVDRNLAIAFGEEFAETDRKKLCQQTYQNYGIVLLEVLLLKFIQPANLPRYIELEGLDTLDSAIKEGKGVVLAGNHFGNWELISAAISTMGSPIHVYAGRQRNNLFDDSLNAIRQRFGAVTISKSKAATIEMMKVLKNKQVLGMAGDLNVPRDTLFVDFFGRKASIGRGLASFTLSRRCPLIFIWCIRTEGLKHKGFLTRVDYQVTGDRNRDLMSISQTLTQALEEKIRSYPDQYFWFNQRWKTRPENEKEVDIYQGN